MFNFGKNKIRSVAAGRLLPIAEVPDQVFSTKMLGDGYAVAEHDGKVYAPAKGVIEDVFPTKHSMTLAVPSGAKILIHMGIDTVALKGEGFELFVKQGDSVKAGDLLAEMDLDVMKRHGKESMVIVVAPEQKISLCDKPGLVDSKTTVMTLDDN